MIDGRLSLRFGEAKAPTACQNSRHFGQIRTVRQVSNLYVSAK
jgi:hypothetical protein